MRDTAEMRDWITVLRRTTKEQGSGFLCVRERYCCLGILADIYDKLEVKETDEFVKLVRKSDGTPLESSLPEEFLNEVGMTKVDQEYCYTMNDSLGWPFAKIADVLEAALGEYAGDLRWAIEMQKEKDLHHARL